ncbi:hypothetical protein BDR26DRAFT_141652 [Obelidium mucronatum]|nr:hypothetical protein BDR26DRAFT_141652 [Obelidium mucronatum]
MSSEPDFGFDFGGSLFDINPFFRDGAMNQGLSNLTPAEVQGIPGTADDELERFLENAVFTDQWNETMNQNPETPHDMKLDFSFLHELCPAPELLPSTPVPPTTTSSSKALTENRNISNQANLLSSPIFNTASFNKPSPSNLLQETPVAPSSKLKEELRIRSTENTGERRSIRDENTQPAFSSDGKVRCVISWSANISSSNRFIKNRENGEPNQIGLLQTKDRSNVMMRMH